MAHHRSKLLIFSYLYFVKRANRAFKFSQQLASVARDTCPCVLQFSVGSEAKLHGVHLLEHRSQTRSRIAVYPIERWGGEDWLRALNSSPQGYRMVSLASPLEHQARGRHEIASVGRAAT